MSTNNSPADPDPVGSAVRAAIRPRMTSHEIGFMLAASIRGPQTHLAASERLNSDLFEPDEARYALLWRGAVNAAAAGKGLLPQNTDSAREIVATYCAAEVETDTTKRYYTPSVERDVMAQGGLLEEVFALPMDESVDDQGISFLARFIAERKTGDPLRRALAGIPTQSTISDPAQLIAILEKHAYEVGGLTKDPGSDAFVDTLDFIPPGPVITPTGVAGLDELMNGGQAPGEVYTLLGPSGGGKTALVSQVAIEGAQLQSAIAAELGADKAGHWYYFTWELTEVELRVRLYGYAARVHVDSFKQEPGAGSKVKLSTSEQPSSLKPYEFDPYVNPPGCPVLGEVERLRAAARRLSGNNCRLRIVDFSANAESGGGNGGVDEVVRYLRRENARGRRVAGVVIDYAGLVVDRYIESMKLKPSECYALLPGFVNQVRSKAAIPFNSPAWVLHQLHGSASKGPSGRVAHHSDARGCRNFADNATFGIQMGNYIPKSGIMQIKATKHRRAPGRENGVIMKFDGRFGYFSDPDQSYVVDPMTHQIVPQEFLGSQIASPSSVKLPGPPPELFDPEID